jgi:hypothetical protein
MIHLLGFGRGSRGSASFQSIAPAPFRAAELGGQGTARQPPEAGSPNLPNLYLDSRQAYTRSALADRSIHSPMIRGAHATTAFVRPPVSTRRQSPHARPCDPDRTGIATHRRGRGAHLPGHLHQRGHVQPSWNRNCRLRGTYSWAVTARTRTSCISLLRERWSARGPFRFGIWDPQTELRWTARANVFVTDYDGAKVLKYTSSGALITSLGLVIAAGGSRRQTARETCSSWN